MNHGLWIFPPLKNQKIRELALGFNSHIVQNGNWHVVSSRYRPSLVPRPYCIRASEVSEGGRVWERD